MCVRVAATRPTVFYAVWFPQFDGGSGSHPVPLAGLVLKGPAGSEAATFRNVCIRSNVVGIYRSERELEAVLAREDQTLASVQWITAVHYREWHFQQSNYESQILPQVTTKPVAELRDAEIGDEMAGFGSMGTVCSFPSFHDGFALTIVRRTAIGTSITIALPGDVKSSISLGDDRVLQESKRYAPSEFWEHLRWDGTQWISVE